MMTEVEPELIPRQPTSMALLVTVVTPGTVADVADAPVALDAAVSRPAAPVYRAIPPPLVTLAENPQR